MPTFIQLAPLASEAKIYVAGHRGLVGEALIRKLREQGYNNLIYRTHAELDLCDQAAVNTFFDQEKPDYVFLAAAHVGGIYANNTYPADFIYNNLMISANIIHAAHRTHVKKLLFLGSSCIYPRDCPQPIKEEYLLSGPLEKTNQPYALAKIAGIELCQSYNRQHGTHYIACMPTNLYGENDNFHPENSHVIPGLIRKFVTAQQSNTPEVVCWGTGSACREFLHVDDLACACIFLMENYEKYDTNSWINIGCGHDLSIKELIMLIKELCGYEGKVIFDATQPDGTPRKLLDISRITALGWKPTISLREGLSNVITHYKAHISIH